MHMRGLVLAVFAVALTAMQLVAQQSAPPSKAPETKQSGQDVSKGYLAAPPGSEPLSVVMVSPSIQLFANKNFGGDNANLDKLDTVHPQAKANPMPDDLKDTVSSLRWNLPPGALVVLYEDAQLKGEQLAIWGSGEMPELSRWDFNDKASRWAWFNVGGGGALRGDATMVPPLGSESLGVMLPDSTVQMYKGKNFRDDMTQASPVTAVRVGELQKIDPSIDDSLTSLQWNLPPGVIVTMYQDGDGKKQRITIWGKGQVGDLDVWDFNDKVSRWSWAYIGDPKTVP